MADVFLSPSTQYYNPYITGGNERLYMNALADAIEPYLRASAISFSRNDPNLSVTQSIEASNAGNYKLHLALHSNAAPPGREGELRGSDVYYYPDSAKGLAAANLIADQIKLIYPLPELVRTVSSDTMAELVKTKAPAVLIEIAYHDNLEDATWIINNIDLIAQAIARAVASFLSRPFVKPDGPCVGIITVREGPLNIRKEPSIEAKIVGRANDGDTLTVFGEYGDWYSVQFGEARGFASSQYIRRVCKQE